MIYITLLSNAVTDFKKYKCPRMKRYMMVLIGEEYFRCSDYTNAVSFFNNVLNDYREERWQPLFVSVLKSTMFAAYLSADVVTFIKTGLEYIASWINVSSEEKPLIQVNVYNILHGKPLVAIPGYDLTPASSTLWGEALLHFSPTRIVMPMQNVIPFIECKPRFTSKHVCVDQKIVLQLYFRINCPKSMKFARLNVSFLNASYNQLCEFVPAKANDQSTALYTSCSDLLLIPKKLHMISFSFYPLNEDVNKNITINEVTLIFGNGAFSDVVLKWSFINTPRKNEFVGRDFFKSNQTQDDITFQQIIPQSSVEILPHKSNVLLTLNHDSPALLHELYPIRLSLKNQESNTVTKLEVSFKCFRLDGDNLTEVEGNIYLDQANMVPIASSNFYELVSLLEVGDIFSKILFFSIPDPGFYYLKVFLSYEVLIHLEDTETKSLNCKCFVVEQISLEAISPFLSFFSFSNLISNEAVCLRTEEPFFLKVSTKFLSSLSLNILERHVELIDPAMQLLENAEVKGSDDICDQYKLCCQNVISEETSIGFYCIKWQRKSSICDNLPIRETRTLLPPLIVDKSFLFVELCLPDCAFARKPLTLTYLVFNRTDELVSLELAFGSSDNFMYSGNKLVSLRQICRNHFNY